jgi:hypothetical protein
MRKCQCEHVDHFDSKDHPYGELSDGVQPTPTTYGTFALCPHCRDKHCMVDVDAALAQHGPLSDDQAEALFRTVVRVMYEGCTRRGDTQGAAQLEDQEAVVARMMKVRAER